MRAILVLAVTMTVALVGCKKNKPLPPDTAPAPAQPESSGGGISHAGGVGVVTNPNEALNGGGAPRNTSPPPTYSSSTGGATAPNQSGNLSVTGGQGAIQSPRMAAARTINNAQLRDLHLNMSQTFLLDNRVPSIDEITNEAKKNSQLYPLIRDEVIILTGTNRGDGVWAYSRFPQRANEHYVITSEGVIQMAPEALRKRLEQQMSPIKMEK